MKLKRGSRQKRIKRTKGKIFGTESFPRLAVFRSNKRIYAQAIDDSKGETLASASDFDLGKNLSKLERAKKVGERLGVKLVELGIKTVRFDRRGFAFHGRIKALAEGVKSADVKI